MHGQNSPVSSFYTDRLVEINLVPCWDLAMVLDAFTKSPFEPRDRASIDLKFLTFKMVFLLSLASRAWSEGKYML